MSDEQAGETQWLTEAERSALLDAEVEWYVRVQGFQVIMRTPTTAQLHRPARKHFGTSCFMVVITLGSWLVLELILQAIGFFDELNIYLRVDEHGEVHKTQE